MLALLSSITVCTILGAVICFWLFNPSAAVTHAYVSIGSVILGAIVGFSIGVSVGIALIWKITR